jgi:hypothetical protein
VAALRSLGTFSGTTGASGSMLFDPFARVSTYLHALRINLTAVATLGVLRLFRKGVRGFISRRNGLGVCPRIHFFC